MTRDAFFAALCRRFGWEPTAWRLAVFEYWATQEGMPFDRTFNPLATTRLSPGIRLDTTYDEGFGPGNWNGVPVRVYATPEDGITATFETLSLDYYPSIRRCFADQTGHAEAVAEFATYVGSESYGRRVVDFMNATAASPAAAGGADLARDVLAATYGSEERMRTLLANNAALERRVSHLESPDGPIGDLAAQLGALIEHVATVPGLDPAILAALAALGEAAKNALARTPPRP